MSITQDQIDSWRLMVSQAQVEKCLEEICTRRSTLKNGQANTAIILMGKAVQLKMEIGKGTISEENRKLREAEINDSLLELIDELEQDLEKALEKSITFSLSKDEAEFQEKLLSTLPPGKYSHLECISDGSSCMVYLAVRDKGQAYEEKVAIKAFKNVSLIDGENGTDLLALFRKSRRYSRVDGVIPIYDDNLNTLPRYYIMPYIDGITLDKYLKLDWALSFREIKRMLLSITLTLIEGHRQNLLHLGVNPTNIRIDREGKTRIFPFQVIRFTVGDRDTERIKQIISYWSPEQINGEMPQKTKDQYALGLVAFELFTHRPLFSGKTMLDVLTKRIAVKEQPALIEKELRKTQCPAAMIPIIRRLLAEKPEDRYADMEEVWDEIDAVPAPRNRRSGAREDFWELQESFSRCRSKEGFYRDFYAHFFQHSPQSEVLFKSHFANKSTQSKLAEDSLWEFQHRVLDLAVDRFLHFYTKPDYIKSRIGRLYKDHENLGVPPEDFPVFFNCLKTSLIKYDAEAWEKNAQSLHDCWEDLTSRFFEMARSGS